MNVLFFATTDFYRKPNPSFHLMVSMIEDILNAGHRVYFIGISEEGLEKHIPECLLNREGFKFRLVNQQHVSKTRFIKRYLSGVSYAFKARKFLKEFIPQCDVIFVRSSPTVAFNLLFVNRYKKKQKVILNIQDMFPGASIATGVMKNAVLKFLFYKFQKIAYIKSDCIVAISNDMKKKLTEEKVPEEKIRVIVNWYDDKSVQEVAWEENRFVRKYNMSKDIFYVQYAGTMGLVFDYKTVLDVAEKLRDYSDIRIQMIGEGSQKSKFTEEARQRNLSNISFLPLEPQEMVSDVYSACCVCFIPLKKNVIGNCVPSKAALLMACRRPIITSVDENCDYYNMINSNKIGIAVPNDRLDEAVAAILRLYKNRNECGEMGINGYNFGYKAYSRSLNMSEYIKLFEDSGCI